jgi:hypothetical protein
MATGRWKIDPRGADDLRVVEIDGATGEDDRVGPCGVCRAHDRAGVAGIAHLFEDGDEFRLRGEHVFHGRRELTADRHEPLRRHRVGHRVEHLFGDELDLDVGGGCGLGDFGVAFERARCREELDDEFGTEGERLGDRLGALEQEHPAVGTCCLAGELRYCAHARRSGILEHASNSIGGMRNGPAHLLCSRGAGPFEAEVAAYAAVFGAEVSAGSA